jgi:protein-L-isoaspartate(D-aspartate) O-methyltransferase
VSQHDFSAMRAAMVSNQLRTNNVNDPRVVAAMEAVPREQFVPEDRRALAYVDVPIPLGNGRALNSPLATGRLITEAKVEPGEKVLLIGAATGYAAAVLVQLGAKVIGLEEDGDLSGSTKSPDVARVCGPLSAGWKKSAPYDVIIADGSIEVIPDTLRDQLVEGGRFLGGLLDGGVSRLVVGRRVGKSLSLIPFAEIETVRLPGFEKPKVFSF